MAQDDRKGQPPSTRGRSRAPDTPDTRAMNAPPLPEAPEPPAPGLVEPQPEPGMMAGDGDTDTDSGEETERSDSERLRAEIDKAREALEAKEAELARIEAQRREDDAIAKLESDYAPEIPALEASERDLRQYRAAEISFLETILPSSARGAIREVHKGPEQEIARLGTAIAQKERRIAEARRTLAEARQAAAEAKEKAEALKRPAASVRDRLKRAEAVRAEAAKARDAGHHALAYWLVMDGGRLERAIEADLPIIAPGTLAGSVKAAIAGQKEADERVATLVKEIETTEASLQADRAQLAERQRGFDTTVLAELSKLNPQTAPAA